jgi:Polysaccharide lyase 14
MKCTTKFFVALLLVGALESLAASSARDPIIDVQFESDALGQYTHDMVCKDWGTVPWTQLYGRAHIIQDQEAKRGKVLKIAYPKGAVGPKHGGGQFVISLPPSKELWLSYYVKFGKDFDFKRGGKLPGLTSGGGRYTGGNKPQNGEGWSARFMWRKGGRAVVYLYYVDMSGKWGDNLSLKDFAFTPGTWHQITQHIKVNTADKTDGIIEVWLDGKKVLSRLDIRLRIGDKGLINSLYFSTFHGGNTKGWAPGVDCFTFFDKFVVSRKPLVPLATMEFPNKSDADDGK